jgi:hypothetical protein
MEKSELKPKIILAKTQHTLKIQDLSDISPYQLASTDRRFGGNRNLHFKGTTYTITGLDRPLGFQEAEAPRMSRQSAHEGGKVVSPTHRPSLTPGKIPGTHFC